MRVGSDGELVGKLIRRTCHTSCAGMVVSKPKSLACSWTFERYAGTDGRCRVGAMGFLDRLRSKSTQTTSRAVELPGGDLVAIVGEANYQPAIARACGSTTWEYVRCEIGQITVVPEHGNQHDPNAVAVFIDSEKVGYLSRSDALDYRPAMDALRNGGYDAGICRGSIAGRGPGSDTKNLGVFLHLANPDEVLAALS
jgi:hypothetical protein